MATESPIRKTDGLFRGEDKVLQYTIVDSADVAVNITGWTFTWIMRAGASYAGTALLELTSAGGACAITNAAGGIMTVTITDTQLDPIQPGTYYYELWRNNAGNETVLAYGDVTLRPSNKRAS